MGIRRERRQRKRMREKAGREGGRKYNPSSVVAMVTSLQSRLMEVLPIVRLDTSTL